MFWQVQRFEADAITKIGTAPESHRPWISGPGDLYLGGRIAAQRAAVII